MIALKLNGNEVRYDGDPTMPLLWLGFVGYRSRPTMSELAETILRRIWAVPNEKVSRAAFGTATWMSAAVTGMCRTACPR